MNITYRFDLFPVDGPTELEECVDSVGCSCYLYGGGVSEDGVHAVEVTVDHDGGSTS